MTTKLRNYSDSDKLCFDLLFGRFSNFDDVLAVVM